MGDHSVRSYSSVSQPSFLAFLRLLCFLFVCLFFDVSNGEKEISSPAAPTRRVTFCQGGPCMNEEETQKEENESSNSFHDWEENEGPKIEEGDFKKNTSREPLRNAMKLLVNKLQMKVRKMLDEGPPPYDEAAFRDLGCIALASPSLPAFSGAVALFPSALLISVSSSLSSFSSFSSSANLESFCFSHLTPLAVNLHSNSLVKLPTKGHLNATGLCSRDAIGPIHSYCHSPQFNPHSFHLQQQQTPSFNNPHHQQTHASHLHQQQIPSFNNKTKQRPTRNLFHHQLPNTPRISDQHELWKQKKVHRCTPRVYEERPFACRPGDFLGKFGFPVDVSPSVVSVDLRLVELDRHAESPCVADEDALTVVLSCAHSRRALACAPVKRLETLPPVEALEMLLLLLEESEKTAEVLNTNKQLQAFLSIVSELQARINLIECGAKPSTMGKQ